MSDSKKDKIKKFLDIISFIESSRGKNLKHKTIKTGMHAGESAKGQYGLMPKTKDEMINRFKLNYTPTPDKMGELMAEHLLDRTGGDEEAAAAGWMWGHNHKLDTLDKLKDTEYVQKYRKEKLKQEMRDTERNPGKMSSYGDENIVSNLASLENKKPEQRFTSIMDVLDPRKKKKIKSSICR